MKSPHELKSRLVKQWRNTAIRTQRLLSSNAWPLRLNIGFPDTATFVNNPAGVRKHIEDWRRLRIGEVFWEQKQFRESGEPVSLPKIWQLDKPSEWICATDNKQIKREYTQLEQLVSAVDPDFHPLLVQKHTVLLSKPLEEIVLAASIAKSIEPGCARGKPLRALSMQQCDSKFFERNRRLLTWLLDVLFDDAVSEVGLERFLGALDERDHWLLIVPLAGGLLPFKQCRVRSSELQQEELPANYLLLVENEQCVHQLPPLNDTIAVLGAGLNLTWLSASWLSSKKLAYWGDMDTWGLSMLATAKTHQPAIESLLMSQALFGLYKDRAVKEPHPAGVTPPVGLNRSEKIFYQFLHAADKGRLEQEFLPQETVAQALESWHGKHWGTPD